MRRPAAPLVLDVPDELPPIDERSAPALLELLQLLDDVDLDDDDGECP